MRSAIGDMRVTSSKCNGGCCNRSSPKTSLSPLDSNIQSVLFQPDTLDFWVANADSKHVAHFATSGTTRGVFLDGKFIPASQEGVNTKLVFSPDSKHLFWIHQYSNNPYRLFIDGKPLMDFYGAGQNLTIPHWWEFGPDGTLSFLAQDDNSLKRITITPSGDTNLATMVGGTAFASRGN